MNEKEKIKAITSMIDNEIADAKRKIDAVLEKISEMKNDENELYDDYLQEAYDCAKDALGLLEYSCFHLGEYVSCNDGEM